MISAVITYSDNRVSIHSAVAKNVGTKFSKGFYKAITRDNNLVITMEKLEELHVPHRTEENELILSTIQGFFSNNVKEKINKLGFIHKLGILIHGKQGTGKTSLNNFIASKLVDEREAIVLFCDNKNSLSSGISLAAMIRKVQDNPIIFIADEFERYAREGESEMKQFLDGNASIDNSLFLAATNYIDKVPETLKDRPSRFKLTLEIKGMRDKKLIREALESISNKISPSLFTQEELDAEVEQQNEVTLDEIKHLCLDKITDTYVPKVKRPQIGFNASREEELVPTFKASSMANAIGSLFWGSGERKGTISVIDINSGSDNDLDGETSNI